jgi:hypothetical protein
MESSVGIANGQSLMHQGPNLGGNVIFRNLQTGHEAQPASYTMGTGSFPRVKRSRLGVVHPPHVVSRLKKKYSYAYSHFGPYWVSCAVKHINLNKKNFTNRH